MAQSLNTTADFVCDGTAFTGFAHYGEIMVGDRAFEFYYEGNPNRNIQIPWEDITMVSAVILFKGKWIPRIGITTKTAGAIMFAAKEPKKLLKAISRHVDRSIMYRSWTFFETIRKRLAQKFGKKKAA